MHKLIRYGLIVHGCVDGFSRAVIWMKLSTNNRATTQLEYFEEAILEHGFPARMRGDKGGENVRIADVMAVAHNNSNAFIFGTSQHNVRIERHWRDLRRDVSFFVNYVDI